MKLRPRNDNTYNPAEAPAKEVVLPLTDAQKELMFAATLCDRSLFRTAHSRLDPRHHFRGANLPFGLLWQAAIDLYAPAEELPEMELLRAEMENLLQDSVYENLGV